MGCLTVLSHFICSHSKVGKFILFFLSSPLIMSLIGMEMVAELMVGI